jgi:phosphoribosylanthranilate isomerase
MSSAAVRIKVCGLTRQQDVAVVQGLGCEYAGFILAQGSPRQVSVSQAHALAQGLLPHTMPVLVVVNPTEAQVAEIESVFTPGRYLVQFHGGESPQRCSELAARLGCQFWRAVPVPTNAADARQRTTALLNYVAQFPGTQAMLLDSAIASAGAGQTQFGGTGHTFDWHTVQWSRLTQNAACHLVLSGGLNAANVADGIRQAQPWCVDVSSGVEARDANDNALKGIKDPQALRAFVAACRQGS